MHKLRCHTIFISRYLLVKKKKRKEKKRKGKEGTGKERKEKIELGSQCLSVGTVHGT